MKKKIIIGIIIVGIIVLAIICNINFKNEDEEVISDALKFKEEYEAYNDKINEKNQKKYPNVTISENNAIKYSSIDDIIEVLDKKTGVIYLGFPQCPWCRNAVPILLSAAKSAGLDQIYYLNMYEVRDTYELDDNNNPVLKSEGDAKYQNLLKSLDTILEDYTLETEDGKKVPVGEKRVYVPLVVFVKDGQIINYHADTVDSQEDPYQELNDDQIEELYNIYIDNILKVQESTCDDNC